jgi:hypothetical protein
MSTPAPAPQPGPLGPPGPGGGPGKRPLVVVSGYQKREVIIGILLAVAVVGLLVFAVFKMGTEESRTTGVVMGRYDKGERETELTVGLSAKPKGGVKSKTVDTGFYLKVRVEGEGVILDVMVSEEDYRRYKDGDTIKFIRE